MTEPLPSDPAIERFKVTPFLTRTEPKEQGAYVIIDGPDIAWFKDPAGNVISVIEE